MEGFINFCKSKKILIVIISLVTLLSMITLYRSIDERNKAYILKEDKIVGVTGEAALEGVSVSVEAVREGVKVQREILVKRSSLNEEKKIDRYELSPEDELETEITRLNRTINQSQVEGRGEDLIFPEKIEDSISLSWSRKDNKFTWLLPLFFPPLILLFMYRGERDEIKQKEKKETDRIIQELPSFNNKLVLLLGSGLVYEESLKRIAFSGGKLENLVLQKRVKEAVKEAESTNRDATKLLNEYARKKKISELKRVTTIIMDNQRKGTDLRSKLVLEGELLWDRRKKRAEEYGKTAESKLTLPLGIMLISLLIVTAGPALMQM